MAKKKFPPFLQADDYFVITKSDTVNFVADTSGNPQLYPVAAVYVGTGGDVALVSPTLDPDGNDKVVTFKNVPSGTALPILTKRVNSTNTTASNMVGLVGLAGPA